MSDVQEREHDGPLTRVTKLKIGGDWDWNVSYIQTFQELTVHTNDQPKDSMTQAIAHVVMKALAYIKIKDVSVLMESIAFGEGEKGPTFTLTLSARPSENPYLKMKWSLPKIDREIKTDPRTNDDSKGFCERNRLNEAIDILEEEIKQYALGNRLQKEMEFEKKSEPAERQRDLFSVTEIAQRAGNRFAESMRAIGGKVSVGGPNAIEVDFGSGTAVQK